MWRRILAATSYTAGTAVKLASGAEGEIVSLLGAAMAPTLNSTSAGMETAERVLIKKLIASRATVHVGDVVACTSPSLPAGALIVRRVVAGPGDALVRNLDAAGRERYVLGDDELWVTCDNPARNPELSLDSRDIGPLRFSDVVGRAIWRVEPAAPIGNSDAALEADSKDITGLM
eukprot:a9497_82.p1 GENE.a9497_82~~a9497_82.p1  ORF type:complete len:187 (-),score=54.47 a9497_82:178-702(-)